MKEADPSGVYTLYSAQSLDPFGRVLKALYGGHTNYRAAYAESGRRLIKEADIKSSQGSRRVTFEQFDPLGRGLSRREIKDGAASGPETVVSYDALGRLANAKRGNGPASPFNWTFSYDALGNIQALKNLIDPAGVVALSYQDVDRDRVCRIGYGNSGLGSNPACDVAHDVVGNVISEPASTGSRHFTYFPSGDVRTITGQGAQATFAYDPFGQVQQLDLQGPTAQDQRHDRRYGGFIERSDITSGSSTTPLLTRNIPGPGGVLASRRGPGNDWVFEFGELRGNRFFTNQDGVFVQDLNYQPFGKATSTGAPSGTADFTSYQWNGGDALAAFGLSHLGVRIYDPVIGRFLARDPLLVSRTATTSNPYAFAVNDPMNAADPSGLDCVGGDENCNQDVPVVGPGGGNGSPSPAAPKPTTAPTPQMPPVSIGPQTPAGITLYAESELINGYVPGGFSVDAYARSPASMSAKLDAMATVASPERDAAITAQHARIDRYEHYARNGGLLLAAGAVGVGLAATVAAVEAGAGVAATTGLTRIVVPEGLAFFAIVDKGQVIAWTSNSYLSHAEWVQRALDKLGEGAVLSKTAEVVTFGRYSGPELIVLLSQTIHGQGYAASYEAQAAIRMLFR